MGKHLLLNKIIEYPEEIEVTRLANDKYRVGYCSRCGECCRTISLDTRVGNNAIEYIKLHNVEIKIKTSIVVDPKEEPTEFAASLTFTCPCQHLIKIPYKIEDTDIEDQPDNRYFCRIYDTRPAICSSYPKNQSSWKTCTFTFLDSEKLDWFIKQYSEYWREKDGKEKKINYRN